MPPTEPPTLPNDSNWTFMYVVLGLIPFAFVAIALFSTWRDEAARKEPDYEMTRPYQRSWFPWREAVAASEGPRRPAHVAPPARAAAARPPVRPPVLPPNFVGRIGELSGERVTHKNTGSKRGTPIRLGAARTGQRKDQHVNGGKFGDIGGHSRDFEDVPL
ncbi:hypothetical protein AAE478_004848 [Parahypoxylon ruwenzoriense]